MQSITDHNRRIKERRLLCLLAGWVLMGTIAFAGAALPQPQDPAPPAAEQKATKKKPRGRLPAYFAKVVTQQQREDIYEIQARYNAQIEELQKQIDELVAKRDQEVEGVLSAEQLAEVKKMREEAKKRRTARRNTDDGKQQ